ncbi:putative bifunctional diguanylate cyclase/phosphodiesterase [Sphingomonas xanthus]|uniref:EAL domain-containing protein n=1 Tax=Sphingomonas xanthus TaxID=2594473 RepID=A0A516ITB7_9SPHN|nr:EAL domain-containing protein [Sphingomonas xanthus]QDP20110.1 EAL domain-containing protein [Sphingomonas xanthus]
MGRTRFAGLDKGKQRVRASVWDALTFDLRHPETIDDENLATQRVAMFDLAPALIGATHMLWGLACIFMHPEVMVLPLSVSPLLPLALALGLDLLAFLALRLRDRLNLPPRVMARLLCGYIGVGGALWMAYGAALGATPHDNSLAIGLAFGAGLGAATIISIASPPVTIVNALVALFGTLLIAPTTELLAGVAFLAAINVAYSIASAQTVIANSMERLKLDAQARKALHFVDEFENSGRGWFWETNSLGTLSYVSQQLADDFKLTPQELLGRQFTDLLSVDSGSADSLRGDRTLGFHLSARFPFSEVIVRAASDEDVHWSLSGNPVFDERGRFLGFRGIGTDLTEQRRSEQEISRLARFDSLTGLPNRALMRQTLDEALRNATNRRKGCSLFLIDLDRFKNVNDTLGHPIGDALLRQVGERLKSVMGNHGQIGRLGGDEFKAVLPGTVETGLLESLARTLIEQVSRPYSIEGHRVTIGASVGIAIGDPGRSCADSLIRNADLALYAAKAAGRGKHCFYEASMHSEAADRQLLENDLRQALDRGEMWVAFQPIVRVASEEISGFEALVRWNHPTRGAVSPDKFISVAEECGMIGKIGEYVLRTAVAEAARWPDNVRIAVNLSPIQFNDPNIVDTVAAVLAEYDLIPSRLELEITEGVFLADSDMTDSTFARLKSLGVRLALDDFGTGYSSLGYLKKAPFDKIKIDQSFVRGAASTTRRNGAIIRAIVTLAESLGMDTTAEGVETHDDLYLIRELGVSQVQGYIFGKPLPAAETKELANSTRVEADGFQCIREPRHRLMRRAIASIGGQPCEIRLRNISAMGALVECSQAVTPGTTMTIDIVGVGPVVGLVRWAHAGKFGVQFDEQFDLGRLAPKQKRSNETTMLQPWYVTKAS